MKSKSEQKRLKALGVRGLTHDSLREIIQEWRWFWMNQDLSSEEGRLNYYRRAVGVDANMAHDLVRRITDAQEEVARLHRVIAQELTENDELGSEYTYVMTLKEAVAHFTERLKEAEQALQYYSDTKAYHECDLEQGSIARDYLKKHKQPEGDGNKDEHE